MWQGLVFVAIACSVIVCASAAVLGATAGVPVHDPWLFPVLVLLPALVAIGLALTLFGSPGLRANVLLLEIATVAGLYAIETVFHTLDEKPQISVAQELVLARGPGDGRTRQQVARDMRAAGIPAYVTIEGAGMRDPAEAAGLEITIDGRRVIPMANVRNRIVVHCNESGEYVIYTTDEHGFNNPPGLWAGPVDVVAIGDSYIHGSCVDAGETLVADIRRHVPRTLTAAISAIGPLSMLAILEEYVAAVRPRHVFWFYFEGNDLSDLHNEAGFEVLRQYLDATSSQHLIDHADEIDRGLTGFIDQYLDRQPGPAAPRRLLRRTPRDAVREWVRLGRTRKQLALDRVRERMQRCCDFETFEASLVEAKRDVDSWGGQLHFVYLPAGLRYYTRFGAIADDNLRARGRVLRIVRRVGLPILDVHETFLRTNDPRSLFFSARSHYNEQGYRVAADAVVKYLQGLQAGDTVR